MSPFSAVRPNPEFAFDESERLAFAERGYSRVYSHPLLGPGSTLGERAVSAFENVKGLAYPGPTHADMERKLAAGSMWFQSTFTILHELCEIGSHPAIVERVKSILGPDLLLWGVSVLPKPPGEVHCWHTDTSTWETVGAFVGIRGINPGSILNLMTGTHRLGVSPYDIFTTGEWTDVRHESLLTDEKLVLSEAKKLHPEAELVVPEMKQGEFFIFDGLTWHGSKNTSQEHRVAITFFYARPDADIRIPTAFGKTPFYYRDPPPSLLVSGVDRFHKNNIVAAPMRPR